MASKKKQPLDGAKLFESYARERAQVKVVAAEGTNTGLVLSFLRDLATELEAGPLRARFEQQAAAGEIDMAIVDRLGPLVAAAEHARGVSAAARDGEGGSRAKLPVGLVERATMLRTRLMDLLSYHLSDAPTYAARLAAIRAGQGHSDLGDDLVRIGAIWAETEPQLRRDPKLYAAGDGALAEATGREILSTIARAESAASRKARVAFLQQWTLVVDCYELVREVGAYLTRKERGQERFPSVYSPRFRAAPRRKKPKAEGGETA